MSLQLGLGLNVFFQEMTTRFITSYNCKSFFPYGTHSIVTETWPHCSFPCVRHCSLGPKQTKNLVVLEINFAHNKECFLKPSLKPNCRRRIHLFFIIRPLLTVDYVKYTVVAVNSNQLTSKDITNYHTMIMQAYI